MSAGLLIRVGVDSTSGGWNAPCRSDGRFCFVPIPSEPSRRGTAFDRDYSEFVPFVERLGAAWPRHLRGPCHLDPDFAQLTYGDRGRRGRRIRRHLAPGDFIAFWAALRCCDTGDLICALIGSYTIASIVDISRIPPADVHRNAHTRFGPDGLDGDDVVVFADPSRSGRLAKLIEIGRYRDGAQRVDRDLLRDWGGLANGSGGRWPDGYIQMSGAPPLFRDGDRFLRWLRSKRPELAFANNV